MMRWLLLVLLALLTLSSVVGAIDPMPYRNEAEEARFRALTAELRCVMCQNQSLADSNAGIAIDLRREILEMMQAGKTDQEIRDFLVERYTEFVLYDPPMQGNTLLLWLGPILVLLGGFAAVLMIVRNRAKALAANTPTRTDDPTNEDW